MDNQHDVDKGTFGRLHEIEIDAYGARLRGDLVIPRRAIGVVLFAHGSGSSRKSSRNRAVARTLEDAGMATLLLDLFTSAEESRENAGATLRFDVSLLAQRLGAAIEWLAREPATRDLPIGLFGASTGAASALIAAAELPARVRAVVSRGGRPDLAHGALEHLQCPTRLIVGSADEYVLALNRMAFARLRCTKDLCIVLGATHLFEEAGTLQDVARLATEWFTRHLGAGGEQQDAARKDSDRGRAMPPAVDVRQFGTDDARNRTDEGQPEVGPPAHEPSTGEPAGWPVRSPTPDVPAPMPMSPTPSGPEVQPFREVR